MEKIDLDNLDFSDIKTKGLIKVFRQSFHAEITTAILSTIATIEFQKGTLTKQEKYKIIDSIESNFEELISDQLKATYGDGIQEHF